MADAYSENESQDEGDYGGISANTLRFIGGKIDMGLV